MARIKVEKHAGSPARFRVAYEVAAASFVDAECAPPPAPVHRSAQKVVSQSSDTYTISGLTEEEMHILVALTGKCNRMGDLAATLIFDALERAVGPGNIRVEVFSRIGESLSLHRD